MLRSPIGFKKAMLDAKHEYERRHASEPAAPRARRSASGPLAVGQPPAAPVTARRPAARHGVDRRHAGRRPAAASTRTR